MAIGVSLGHWCLKFSRKEDAVIWARMPPKKKRKKEFSKEEWKVQVSMNFGALIRHYILIGVHPRGLSAVFSTARASL